MVPAVLPPVKVKMAEPVPYEFEEFPEHTQRARQLLDKAIAEEMRRLYDDAEDLALKFAHADEHLDYTAANEWGRIRASLAWDSSNTEDYD